MLIVQLILQTLSASAAFVYCGYIPKWTELFSMQGLPDFVSDGFESAHRKREN